MKKEKTLFIAFIGVIAAALAFTIGAVIYQSAVDGIKVFDLANFLCTTVFSLAAIGISVIELVKAQKAEAEEKKKEARICGLKNALGESVRAKIGEVKSIRQIYATEVIFDSPTYSDLPLKRMAELFKEFHTGIDENGDPAEFGINKAVNAVEAYINAVRDVLCHIIAHGEILPDATSAMTVSLYENVERISNELIRFDRLRAINLWTVLNICKNDVYGETEKAKCKYLYDESSNLCMLFDELLARVESSNIWLEVLLKAIEGE